MYMFSNFKVERVKVEIERPKFVWGLLMRGGHDIRGASTRCIGGSVMFLTLKRA